MRKKVFIDGSAGTTGLRIRERLTARDDLELMMLEEDRRKDPSARADAANAADVVFLCLPDDAARESAGLVKNENTVIIDTSTAHRVSEGWTYGFPEAGNRRSQIISSKRIANPGCHASGFIALVLPLVHSGIIAPDTVLSCFSLTGYSGGGKKMIAEYEGPHSQLLDAPRMYGLSQVHKHLPEMKIISGLNSEPVFCPIVAPFYSGMEVTVTLDKSMTRAKKAEIEDVYSQYYRNGLVRFEKDADESGFVSAAAFSGRDDMQISVYGNDERMLLVSRFDNLGKGASGAAIQNMNLVLGCEETAGLVISAS